ncbi:MAG TPA: YdeI/OmpD-associated family protein [Thermoanaerobaculia bacterium]|nr:YdeI/OmpD-associated family protein [Thermoanaerobaculia bacterium]
MPPLFFASPAELRAWLEEHHASALELHVGYWKVGSGRPSVTWPESVDEALCFGWIDGVRRSLDAESYTIRFTPRKPSSNWSAVNVERVRVLTEEGRMRPAGLAAFEQRKEAKTGIYAYEQRGQPLDPAEEAALQANEAAWRDWQSRPPSYRRGAIHWVVSAKQAATRSKRLETLIEHCARGEVIPPFRWAKGAKGEA